jgi:hypothetical protein
MISRARLYHGISRERYKLLERGMVDQLRASWNSLLSWLREVQAWGLADESG